MKLLIRATNSIAELLLCYVPIPGVCAAACGVQDPANRAPGG